MTRVLAPQLERQLVDARLLLGDSRDALTRFGALPEDQARLVGSIAQLDEFFLLVVVGEFNAGKSAFINALVGQPALVEGVTPTTAQIHLLKYGEELDYEEMAQMTGASVSALKMRVKRARDRLRPMLEREGEVDGPR